MNLIFFVLLALLLKTMFSAKTLVDDASSGGSMSGESSESSSSSSSSESSSSESEDEKSVNRLALRRGAAVVNSDTESESFRERGQNQSSKKRVKRATSVSSEEEDDLEGEVDLTFEVASKNKKKEDSDEDSDEEDEGGEEALQEQKGEDEMNGDDMSPNDILELLKTSPSEDLRISLKAIGKVFNRMIQIWCPNDEDEDGEKKEKLWTDSLELACRRYQGSVVHVDKSDPDNPEQMTVLDLYRKKTLEESHIVKASQMEFFALNQIAYAFTTEDLMDCDLVADKKDLKLLEICGDSRDLLAKVDRVARAIQSNRMLLLGFMSFLKSQNPASDVAAPKKFDPNAYDIFDRNAKLTPFQELLMFILRELRKNNYRRFHDRTIWRPLLTELMQHPEGGQMQRFNTCAWVPVLNERSKPMTFAEFITENVKKETHFKMWTNMTSANNLDKLWHYLEMCKEEELPYLEKSRSHISFKNGILELETCTFHGYPIPSASTIISMNYIDQECPCSPTLEDLYKEGVYTRPSQFKTKAERNRAWAFVEWDDLLNLVEPLEEEISTPIFHSIFKMQFSRSAKNCGYWKTREWEGRLLQGDSYIREYSHIIFWHYALLGRLLYKLGHKDNWQVIQFIKGVAGSGKSTLLKLVGWFFREEDVGTLGNRLRGGGNAIGGLEQIYRSLFWRVLEVDEDFQLRRTDFQSMVSGEIVSIDILHKPSVLHNWESHGILAGNSYMNYEDKSGSVRRRVVATVFGTPIEDDLKDPLMEKNLKEELPKILYKCALCYNFLTEMYRGCDIWNVLPKYFTWTKEKMNSEMDPLGSFLNQGFLNGLYKKWHEMDKAMLFSDLKKAFMESPEFKEMSEREKKPIMTVDYEKLVSIFKSSGLDFQKVTEETRARHEQLLGTKIRGKITGNTYVIIGITKADAEVDEDE